MFKGLVDKVQPLNYYDLNGKKLTMIYVEENGFGLLAGKDENGKIYLLKEVLPYK